MQDVREIHVAQQMCHAALPAGQQPKAATAVGAPALHLQLQKEGLSDVACKPCRCPRATCTQPKARGQSIAEGLHSTHV